MGFKSSRLWKVLASKAISLELCLDGIVKGEEDTWEWKKKYLEIAEEPRLLVDGDVFKELMVLMIMATWKKEGGLRETKQTKLKHRR
jgi:hypothetical protein